jgi:hypothetical protein
MKSATISPASSAFIGLGPSRRGTSTPRERSTLSARRAALRARPSPASSRAMAAIAAMLPSSSQAFTSASQALPAAFTAAAAPSASVSRHAASRAAGPVGVGVGSVTGASGPTPRLAALARRASFAVIGRSFFFCISRPAVCFGAGCRMSVSSCFADAAFAEGTEGGAPATFASARGAGGGCCGC